MIVDSERSVNNKECYLTFIQLVMERLLISQCSLEITSKRNNNFAKIYFTTLKIKCLNVCVKSVFTLVQKNILMQFYIFYFFPI